jgi:tRNA(Ile)-lysidine synthase
MNSSIEARFERFIQKHDLFQKKDKLLLAISGGSDSVCLFHLLRKFEYTFECAHVNYMLREQESNDDQAFVKDLCDHHRINLHILKSDLSKLKVEGGNVQATAREKRYEYFRKLSLDHGFTKVLTAHNRTDDVETMIQMMARSSSIRGMSGIPLQRENISRPLLFATSNEILEWIKLNEFQYRTDSSNHSEKYTRNRIRKSVLPSLELIYPDFQSQAGQSLILLKEYNRFFQHQIEYLKKDLVSTRNGYMCIDEVKLRKSGFAELLLFELLNPFGFNKDQCFDILNSSQKGLRYLTNEYELITDRKAYCLRKASKTKKFSFIIDEPGEYDFLDGALQVSTRSIKIPDYKNDNFSAFLNSKKVKFPMLLRSWSAGDSICPMGMNGNRKKVKDILRDKKYNLFDKEKVLVLEIESEICWIPGICSSHNFRILENTENVTMMKFTPYHQTKEQH